MHTVDSLIKNELIRRKFRNVRNMKTVRPYVTNITRSKLTDPQIITLFYVDL